MRLQRTLHELSERRPNKTLRSWTRMTLFVRVPQRPWNEGGSSH